MSYNKYIDEFNIEDNWKINKINNAAYATYKNIFYGKYALKDMNTAAIMVKYKVYLSYLNHQQDKFTNIIYNLRDLLFNYTYKTVQEKKTEFNISIFLEKATEEYNQIVEAKEYFDYLLYKSKYQLLKTKRKNYLNNDYYEFEFDEDNRIVKATSTYARKPVTGTAHCSKEDNFNIIIGMEIAKRKCNTKILNKRIKDLKKQEDKLQNQITELENKMNKIIKYKINAENERTLTEYELKALSNGNAFENCKEKFDFVKVVLDNNE